MKPLASALVPGAYTIRSITSARLPRLSYSIGENDMLGFRCSYRFQTCGCLRILRLLQPESGERTFPRHRCHAQHRGIRSWAVQDPWSGRRARFFSNVLNDPDLHTSSCDLFVGGHIPMRERCTDYKTVISHHCPHVKCVVRILMPFSDGFQGLRSWGGCGAGSAAIVRNFIYVGMLG